MKELTFKIDFRSGVPITLQIVERVKQLLLEGELKADDQLPTVRQLASDLRVNFNTVARAYRMLDEAGLISTQQGRGTYLLGEPEIQADTYIKGQTIAGMVAQLIQEAERRGYSPQELLGEMNRQINIETSDSVSVNERKRE